VDILRHFARAGAAVFGLLILALRPDTGLAASAAEIEIKTDATIKQFVETVDGAQVFLENAKGVLVFPSIVRAGFVFGGQYGEGALRIGGRTVDLTAREFDLLLHFARHPGRVFRRSELLDSVWGYGHEGYEHTVNSHINRLRSKIERDPSHPACIVTVWGVGYKLDPGRSGARA
jgi:hypothetical protein